MTVATPWTPVGNGRAAALREVAELDGAALRDDTVAAVAAGRRVAAAFAAPGEKDETWLFVVLADDAANGLEVARARLAGETFPSLTPRCHELHLFEREIAEQCGIRPAGHPWFKPLRFHRPFVAGPAADRSDAATPRIGDMDYYAIGGDEVHEVAVGPVHAGIIEPGHFRFQCHGETVFHLEISLGYQYRGVERALGAGPDRRSIHYVETVAGDTTIGHAIAYARAVEALADAEKPARAQSWRAIALELERLANHVGDLGALAGDIGFLPTAAYCGRIRGDFLNLTALICGNRFGRGMVVPGGVQFDADDELRRELRRRLAAAAVDTRVAVDLLWDTPTVMARFEEIGRLGPDVARDLGLVGPVARASGVARDVRHDHPFGMYRFAQIPVAVADGGDVFARAYVRWLEIQRSLVFIREQLDNLPAGPVRYAVESPGPRRLVVSLVEGWRGEICHVALTDDDGHFLRYKIVDPSFHNWPGLAMALRNQQISDFPLCNKSFNLSYCGFDG